MLLLLLLLLSQSSSLVSKVEIVGLAFCVETHKQRCWRDLKSAGYQMCSGSKNLCVSVMMMIVKNPCTVVYRYFV